jgi:small subunit ribosomal protein S17
MSADDTAPTGTPTEPTSSEQEQQGVSTQQATAPATSPSGQAGKSGRAARKVREGLVVSDKMDKTVVVAVEDRVKHHLYGKVLTRTTRLKAHDESFGAAVGDRVSIAETRPLSATKRWRVVEVLERAE